MDAGSSSTRANALPQASSLAALQDAPAGPTPRADTAPDTSPAPHPLRAMRRPGKRARTATDTAPPAPARIGPERLPGEVMHPIGGPASAGSPANAALAGTRASLHDVEGPHAQADRLIAQCSSRQAGEVTAYDALALIAQAMQLPDPQKVRALRGMIPAIGSNDRCRQNLFALLDPLRIAVKGIEAPQARYELVHALGAFLLDARLEADVTRGFEHGGASHLAHAFFLRLQSDCHDMLGTHANTLLLLQSVPAPAGHAVASAAANQAAVAAEINGMLACGLYLVNGAGRRVAHWLAMFADAGHGPVETRHAALIGLAGAVRHLVGRQAQGDATEVVLQATPMLPKAHQARVIEKLAQQQSSQGRHGFAEGPIGGLYHRLRGLSLTLTGAQRRDALKHVIGTIGAEARIDRQVLFADMLTQVDACAPADQAPLLATLANRLWELDHVQHIRAAFDGLLARVRSLPPAQRAAPLAALIDSLGQIEPGEQRHIRYHHCASLTRGLPVEAQLAPLKSLFNIDAMPNEVMQMANLQQTLRILAMQPPPTQAALLEEKYLDLENRKDWDVASTVRLALMQAYDHSAAGLPADLKLPVLQAACAAAGWLSGGYRQIAFEQIMDSANSLPQALQAPLHKSVVQAFSSAASNIEDDWKDHGGGATLIDTAALLPPSLKAKVLLQIGYWLRFYPENTTAFERMHALAADLPASTQAALHELLSDPTGDRDEPGSP